MSAFLFISCGKIVNQKRETTLESQISFLMMENQCGEKSPADSRISQEIKKLFFSQQQGLFLITPPSYDFENPLVLSLEKMQQAYNEIKNDPNLNQRAEDLYVLYNGSRRFEDQKCFFKNLAENRKFDLRPYLNIAHNCYKKYQTEKCADTEYTGMSAEKENWTRTNAVDLCRSFSKDINCQAEYSINRRNNSLGEMISRYYKRFHEERFSTLFKLRPAHLKYKCQADSEKTIMKIEVLSSAFDQEFLADLLKHVEETWSTKTFALKLVPVKTYTDGVVSILPTTRSVSYVPDDNNRLVYISTVQDPTALKRVLAHEFGHVLGFPDCYIEFFDNTKKELVYYEISKNNTNIMCSLKEDVRVPDDYFSQLSENSCIFN